MALERGALQLRRMVSDEDREERRLLGRALALLRGEAGLTQEMAGEAFGGSGQNWQKYEAGRAPGVFRPAIQRRLAAALGVTTTDLMLARARVLAADEALRRGGPPGFGESDAAAPGDARPELVDRSGARLAALCAGRNPTLQMPDDHLRPWAISGAAIVYDPAAWPRPDDGCVVRDEEGRLHVKIFVRADAEAIHVRELHPRPRELSFRRGPAVGVYRVTARID
jgi:transcriptional regulator with XRE-family HTH domain